MEYLQLTDDYFDPEQQGLEIVERKGIGHPDTLADALAEAVSKQYSQECLRRFGVILHHNVDKLYIGGGLFRIDFGQCEMVKPIVVRTNGRMSAAFAGETIDLATIQQTAVLPYLRSALSNVDDDGISILDGPTQHTKVPHWFSPRDTEDLPEYEQLKANDTSVCVAHWPFSVTERLAFELERFLWQRVDGLPAPRFDQIGLDAKVMACRQDDHIDVTMCVPVIATKVANIDNYDQQIDWVNDQLNALAQEIVNGTPFSVTVRVNPYQRKYMLGTGSCVECGEEGLVGRGNAACGIISILRPHSVEAWAGKNPAYHTGRVFGYLTQRLAKAIANSLGCQCSVIVMTKNSHSLIPPYLLSVKVDRLIDKSKVESVIESDLLSVDYITEILAQSHVR